MKPGAVPFLFRHGGASWKKQFTPGARRWWRKQNGRKMEEKKEKEKKTVMKAFFLCLSQVTWNKALVSEAIVCPLLPYGYGCRQGVVCDLVASPLTTDRWEWSGSDGGVRLERSVTMVACVAWSFVV